MSNLPRDARIQALHEVGVKIDDELEPAKLLTSRWEGARTALMGAASDIIKASADSKLDANTVMHCAKIVQGLITQASANYFTSLGAQKQIESHVSLVKKIYDLEVALKRREEEPPTPEEMVIERKAPVRTIKEQRLAAAAAAEKQAQEAPQEKQVSPAPKPDVVEDLPTQKKDSRKKKDPAPAAEAPTVEVDVDVSELEGSEVTQEVKSIKRGKKKKRNMSA
jgi:hypothetical protein